MSFMERVPDSPTFNARRIYLGICMNECIEDCNIRGLRNILEDERADPNVRLPELNYTPFHAVAGSEDDIFAEAAARLFLSHNGNPNVRGDEDLTPVHAAASWGHARVLRVLLEGGGSPWLHDELGKTAFDYAKESKDWDTINVLSEFNQKGTVGEGAYSTLLAQMKTIQEPKERGPRNRYSSIFRKKAVCTVTDLPTHLEEDEDKENTLKDNIIIVDLTISDSEESDSSFKNLESSKHNEETQIVRETSTASSSGVSSPIPRSSNSTKSLPDLVYSATSVEPTKRNQETFNFRDEISQPSSSSFCLERLVPKSTTEGLELPGLRIPASFNASEGDEALEVSKETQVQERTHLKKLSSRMSITRANIMRHCKVPKITVTQPSPPILTRERLEEYNSPRALEPEHNYISKRTQQWVDSVKHFSPLVTSSDETPHTRESDSSVEYRLNTAAIGNALDLEGTGSTINSCATVSECYKYADEKNGVVLLEERWLANPVPLSDLAQTSQSSSSTAIAHTDTETIDTENLVKELKSCGIYYGPVTSSTKKVYKLQLRKKKPLNSFFGKLRSGYSFELQRTLKDKRCMYFMNPGNRLEQEVAQQFAKTGCGVNWREGNLKTSFTYLLLDPRITKNLPCRAASLQPKEVWSIFLQSIFYIGKGKRSRPYSHLYEAVQSWKKGELRFANSKVKRIYEIWQEGLGVVCLHVFQNVIPVEAYTREAAMIDAIGVQNLCNMKRSEYYGKAAQWYSYDRNVFGVYLLYRSLQIFLSEGERHLSPFDIM